MSTTFILLQLAAMLATGLMAGIYFSFSVFIMRAFRELPAETAVAAMNSINRVIVKTLFLPLFFLSSLLTLVLMLLMPTTTNIVAGLIYIPGMLLCTMLFNVPLNNQLQAVSSDHITPLWQKYLNQWTRWNHLRTVCSLLACTFYGMSLGQIGT